MRNNNGRNNHSSTSNRLVRTGLFHGLGMLSNATDFVMKRNRNRVKNGYRSLDVPPSKRLRRSRRKRRVQFNDDVQVHSIDHHSLYSEKERKAAFRSRGDIKRHAVRSKLEWYHEGKDWRNAPEESDFLLDVRYWIHFHPCWTIPREPHHSGVVLYGIGNDQRASYCNLLSQYIAKYGVKAFFDK